MKKLHNLSIKKKFAIVLIPLVTTILCFDFLHIKNDFLDYQDSKRLNKAINLGIEINELVHEIQKERSVSVGFQSNGGRIFGSELVSQRNRTDSLLSKFYQELRSTEYQEAVSLHRGDVDDLKANLLRLSDLRQDVDNHEITTKQIVNYYSEINNNALYVLNKLINETRDKEAAQQVHAIIYFLEAKEYASVERAYGTSILSLPKLSDEMITEFTRLVATQEAYTLAFLTISNQESYDYYYHILKGQDIDDVKKLRSSINNASFAQKDPAYYHRVNTSKINAMKRVEEFMLNNMHNYTESHAKQSRIDFITFLIVDLVVGFITLMLVTIILSKLIKNIAKLEGFTKRIASGKLDQKVHIDTKDEIGKYANTFNLMTHEIQKSHEALKAERDQAEYMYENIYKQSEVVFENVEQGIFLLDSELKISNLYSKAVERIFDNEIIANENFCNFMRPRIIQRDFEALEMFMKHLFNADMDEDVVNQLNPIEQVKIFISTNGVVITKYLRVSFTRIERAGTIQSILVTISDETESFLLQQHMEESEAKKKKDTEYLLNILKVEPNTLREFLEETRSTIKSISLRYEQSTKGDLNQLLKYTFEVVHSIKGNATSLGVELISEKVHEIEESIIEIRDKNVTADKFLALLYELEEIDKMITDMHRMLDKVGEIYQNFNSKESKEAPKPAQKLENDLKGSLKRLCKQAGKNAELEFANSGVNLPEEYVKPLKDISIQMIRNSLSHGIEDPIVRNEKGKLEVGQLTISLTQSDLEGIIVSYQDDGKGLNLDQILSKAIEQGLVDEETAETLNPKEIAFMLFDSGFSTKDKADELSGRGQGMSLVKSIVEELNGSLNIDFEKDKFFKLSFSIPQVQQRKKVA